MTNKESEAKTYYYGVVYFYNGEASISRPYEDYETMMEDMKKGVSRHADKVKATSYITRKEKLSTMDILGHPKSRDIMQDKIFLKEITI